jgi:hypothetical protein
MPIVTNDLIHAHIANGAELRSLQEGLARLESYLSSEKFALDPTVQVRDVMERLRTVRAEAWGAACEAI